MVYEIDMNTRFSFFVLVVCVVFGVVINMLCFFEGLSITSPINASLIMITTPLLVYIISFFLSEEPNPQFKPAYMPDDDPPLRVKK